MAGYAAFYAIALLFAGTSKMQDRFTRLSLGALVFLVAAFVAQPYIDRIFFSGTPRPVELRGSLAEAERTAIDIFRQTSPSWFT